MDKDIMEYMLCRELLKTRHIPDASEIQEMRKKIKASIKSGKDKFSLDGSTSLPGRIPRKMIKGRK